MKPVNVGELLTGDEQRDAIHVAVAPMVAGEGMLPGERIAIGKDGLACRASIAVGIVDPFLRAAVKPGARFWMFLLPNTITSLRHEWYHPAFPAGGVSVARAASEAWLRTFADEYCIGYGELVDGAETGQGACFGRDTPSEEVRTAEFWRHIENVTGKQYNEDHRENTWWHCSC